MGKPIETWVRYSSDEYEMPIYEADTFFTESGYLIEWYHVSVGQVIQVDDLWDLAEVHKWYRENGFEKSP